MKPSTEDVIKWAREAGDEWNDTLPSDREILTRAINLAYAAGAADEREECAKVCDETEEHWSAYKDAALLNGDTDLSNAASGEPRAARFIAERIRARGET